MSQNCQKCQGTKILFISAKCNDLCFSRLGESERDGGVPYEFNIGGGDYLEMRICLDCGQAQGKFPIPEEAITKAFPAPEKSWSEQLE